MTLHFPSLALKDRSHSSSHLFNSSTSSCAVECRLQLVTSFRSSANREVKLSIPPGRSLIKMRNKRGPNTVPCGTPDVTSKGLTDSYSKSPLWEEILYCWNFLRYNISFYFIQEPLMWDRLKAFWKSKYRTSTHSPFARMSYILSIHSRRFDSQDLPGKNPCCSSVISNDMKSNLWFRISFS